MFAAEMWLFEPMCGVYTFITATPPPLASTRGQVFIMVVFIFPVPQEGHKNCPALLESLIGKGSEGGISIVSFRQKHVAIETCAPKTNKNGRWDDSSETNFRRKRDNHVQFLQCVVSVWFLVLQRVVSLPRKKWQINFWGKWLMGGLGTS